MISECGKSKTPVPDGTPTMYSLKAAISFLLSSLSDLQTLLI